MAEKMDPKEQEENNVLKEELDRVEGLLINSRSECDDIGTKYQELSEKMDDLLKLNSEDSDLNDDSMTNQLVEHHKALRYSLEEELGKHKRRISTYQNAHVKQSRVVDGLQNKVEEYRIRCAKLEAALSDYPPPGSPKVIPEFLNQNSSVLDLETALIRLEQERNRCQGLSQVNILLREQLETATEANQALTADIHHLTEEWQKTREELDEKETEWKEEEQSFNDYFTKEHHRLLALWRHILSFRHEFAGMKAATQRDLSLIKSQLGSTTQNVTSACLQFLMVHSSDQTNMEGSSNMNWEIQKLNQDIVSLKLQCDAEKSSLNENVRDLVVKNERKQLLLEEKERIIGALKKTIEAMESNMTQKPENGSFQNGNISRHPEYMNRCHRALVDIMQAVIDDSTHHTWINLKVKGLAHQGSALTSDSVASLQTWSAENRDSQFLPETTVHAIQIGLHKRRLQVEELDMKLTSLKEQIDTQKSMLEDSESERKKSHLLTSHLAGQLETFQQSMDDFLRDKKAVLDESGNQKMWLEETRKSLNEQVDLLNSENDRLHKMLQESQHKLDMLGEERDKLQIVERSLTHDLEKSYRLISVLEDKQENLKVENRKSDEVLQQMSLDKEVLQQEKYNFGQNLLKLQKQCSHLDEELDRLRSEEVSLKNSVESLQTLNESLSQEKLELTKSLSECTDEIEVTKSKLSKDKKALVEEKNDLKELIEKLKQNCQDLEIERNILRENLQSVETSKLEVEDERSKISIQNSDLLNQVTKLLNQKTTLEEELDHSRKELSKLMENSEKTSRENDGLAHQKAELLVKVEMAESDFQQLSETISALREEKEDLEKALYDSQQLGTTVRERKEELESELDNEMMKKTVLQEQLAELKHYKEIDAVNAARQKDALNQRIQQVEQEYRMLLENERHQRKVDMEMFLKEKESQFNRLETVQSDLVKKLQKDQEDLINDHEREATELKKQVMMVEHEYEEKLILLRTESKKTEMESELALSSLQQKVQQIEDELSVSLNKLNEAEKKSTISSEHYQLLLKELELEKTQLNEDIKNITDVHEKALKEIENQITELKQQKEVILEDVARLKTELMDSEKEKQKLKSEWEEMSLIIDNGRHQRELLEEHVAELQQQLVGEKGQSEMTKRSNEEFRNRIKKLQMENNELSHFVEDVKKKLDVMANANNRGKKDSSELRNTLHDVEKSRLEARREIQDLRRQKSALDVALKSRSDELTEMQILQEKAEEKEIELRKEIGSLKQKVMESEATREASLKELMNLRRKLSDVEHKLKLKQEDYQATLQEGLSVERSLSEQRASLERSLSDSVQDIQELRLKLNFSEGRVKALESQMTKLEESKQVLEAKLYNIHLSLRCTLGLGADSGFMSSTHLLLSPFSSRRASPAKLGDSVGSFRELSPSRDRISKSSSPAKQIASWSAMDLDVELVKSALQDMVQKLYITEKERDDLKNEVAKVQRLTDGIKEEHSDKVYRLQHCRKDLEKASQDKENLEEQLSSVKSMLIRHEETIQELEREKRNYSEKMGSLELAISSLETEKRHLQEKILQLKKAEVRGEEERRALAEARELAESKAVKADIALHSHEAEKIQLQKALVAARSEVQTLQQKLEDVNKKHQSTEVVNNSLELTVDRLNKVSQKYADNEALLKEKINSLSKSLSETSSSAHGLQDQINSLKKEYFSCQQEKSGLRHTVETLKATANELKKQNKILNDQFHSLQRDFRNCELKLTESESQIKNYQSLISRSQESEQESVELIKRLEQEKISLQEQVTNLSNSVGKNEEIRSQLERYQHRLEKEKSSLRKTLDKVEKERHKTEEFANRSVLERSALGKTLSTFEIENNELLKKVQSLQAQLAEVELRHSQRLTELTKNQKHEIKLDLERLRTALKQSEQLMDARERTHRQKVLGLEQQIITLKEHLAQEQRRWQQYQLRTIQAGTDISHLHTILNRSLKNVSEDPLKLSPEAHNLDLTIEQELAASPSIFLSTPSKLSVSPANRRSSSTPRAKKRLEPSFKS